MYYSSFNAIFPVRKVLIDALYRISNGDYENAIPILEGFKSLCPYITFMVTISSPLEDNPDEHNSLTLSDYLSSILTSLYEKDMETASNELVFLLMEGPNLNI